LYTDTNKKLSTVAGFTYDNTNSRLTVSNISGGNITITAGGNVNVSDGIFTTSSGQKKTIIQGASSDVTFGNFDVSANTFTANEMKPKYISESQTNITGNSITYTNGSVIYSTNTTTGPYVYTITGVPELDTRSHIITVMVKATTTNYLNCYANSCTVNNIPHALLWNSPTTSAATVMQDSSSTYIVSQQFAILPTNSLGTSFGTFGGNVVLSSITLFGTN